MEFKDWITQKYIDWRGNSVGNDHSISAFARLMGVHQSLVSKWMSGEKKPGMKNAVEIAKIYPEIYDVLGLKKPVSVLTVEESVAKLLDSPPEYLDAVFSAWSEARASMTEKGIDPESRDGHRIIREAFAKRNIKLG